MGGRPRHCPRLHAQPAMLGTNRPLFAPCTGGNGLGMLAWWPWWDYPGCVYLTVGAMARLSPAVRCLLSLCLLAGSVTPVPWWFLFLEGVAEPLHHPSCQVPGSDGTAEHVSVGHLPWTQAPGRMWPLEVLPADVCHTCWE